MSKFENSINSAEFVLYILCWIGSRASAHRTRRYNFYQNTDLLIGLLRASVGMPCLLISWCREILHTVWNSPVSWAEKFAPLKSHSAASTGAVVVAPVDRPEAALRPGAMWKDKPAPSMPRSASTYTSCPPCPPRCRRWSPLGSFCHAQIWLIFIVYAGLLKIRPAFCEWFLSKMIDFIC